MEGYKATRFLCLLMCAYLCVHIFHVCIFTLREGFGEISWHLIQLTYRGHALLGALLPSVCSWKHGCLVLPCQTLETTPSAFPSQWSVWVLVCLHVCLSVSVLPRCSFSFNLYLSQCWTQNICVLNVFFKSFMHFFPSLLCKVGMCGSLGYKYTVINNDKKLHC